MPKFTFYKHFDYTIASHNNRDYADIHKKATGIWELNVYDDNLGYSLQRYFKTLKNAKNYLDSKFDELVEFDVNYNYINSDYCQEVR